MAKILLNGLQASALIGVNPQEAVREQPVRIDIEVSVEELAHAARTERLSDTLDYERLANVTREVIARRHYRLAETLAVEIGRAALAFPGAKAVRVRVEKLECIPGAEGAGVEISLTLDESETRPAPASQVKELESVVIAGGGVAGLSAALWLHRLGQEALVVDPGPRLGGQLHLVHGKMPDIPALDPISGEGLLRRLERQFVAHGGRWLRARVSSAEAGSGRRAVTVATDAPELRLEARALIVASGLRRRRLGVPGEDRLEGRGLLETASRDTAHLGGEAVLVVGGGDSACENALKLAAAGARVTLLFRGPSLSARAEFAQKAAAHPLVELCPRAEVARFEGESHLESVPLRDGRRLHFRWALVRIGWLPNSAGLPAAWLDEAGYLRCDSRLRVAGEHRVFGAGDIRRPAANSVAAAAGDGACAAKAAAFLLESEARLQK